MAYFGHEWKLTDIQNEEMAVEVSREGSNGSRAPQWTNNHSEILVIDEKQ